MAPAARDNVTDAEGPADRERIVAPAARDSAPGTVAPASRDSAPRAAAPRTSPNAQVDALTGAVEDLAGQFALQPLLHRILRRAVSLLGAGAGSISTVDEKAGTYRKEADLGVGCQEGTVFPLAEGATGAVVARRGPRVFDSYAEVPGGHVGTADRERLHATVAVPIEWREEIIGVCVVFSTDPLTRFGTQDVELLDVFAKHAAIAITNARLHQEAEDRARRLAVGAERERVARDVHDTVARALGSILAHIDALEVPGRAPRLEAARAAARAALTETRRTVLGLDPALLELGSLDEAIGAELAWVRSTAGVRTDLVVTGDRRPTAPGAAAHALRLVQEALTNVVAHARARLVRVGVMYDADELAVVVEDDGRGFDPADAGVRRGGTGLTGLVARAGQFGADLRIESTPGWGTRIRARIPYAAGPRGPAGPATPWRVLVVDRRPVVRAGLARLLAGAEPEIHVVGEIDDARQVVPAVRELGPDVVLLDLRMPGLDGARLTSYIRSASPETAVLVMTDDLGDELLKEAVHAGARGCVGSDLDGPGLVRSVLAATRGDVLLTERVLRGFADRDHPGPDPLTCREREVSALVERGLPDKRIATALGISVKTVEKHVGAVLRKTGAPNRTAVAHRAARQGH
ncbi:hybrid sensor histidine kinase/response regulator transcription factor [Streptantibioticus silvisoli]|uniref:Response regulator n=1 Tax=Streptantibioticus silvisoli TaxID=2705255 RepID=A0ABT6VT69_9ACTN|nr:response regulator [Streptantibioticus silvisoli]MDI5961681.1 response regulator [Streptantibioticus silvisoli]